MEIRLAEEDDIQELLEMIKRNTMISVPKVYPQKSATYMKEEHTKSIGTWRKLIKERRVYVAIDNTKVVGCGRVMQFESKNDECKLTAIFVDPDHQRKGVGRYLVQALENTELAKQSKRIELHSSLIALAFWKKLGYEHKDGKLNYNGDGCFIMEKFISTPR